MEVMTELLKRYAREEVTPQEKERVRTYLVNNIDTILQVLGEMRELAKSELSKEIDLSSEPDPVEKLKAMVKCRYENCVPNHYISCGDGMPKVSNNVSIRDRLLDLLLKYE